MYAQQRGSYVNEFPKAVMSQLCSEVFCLSLYQSTFVRVLSSVRILIIHNFSSFSSYQRKQLYTEVIGMDKHGNGGDKEIDERERGIKLMRL